jgi:exodeoxyribonuclease-3
MRLASWNVNSIRMREQALLEWLRQNEPDTVCLQETKVVDEDFPTDELQRLGYAVAIAGQPAYNGVAIATRLPIRDVQIGLLDDVPSAERRFIAATVGDVRVVNVYVPNGKSVASPAFQAKLRWLGRLRATLEACASAQQPLLVCGDFNIALHERDVFDPERLRGRLHFHPDEQSALRELLDFGLFDAYRHFHPQTACYSWWDYRSGSFERNEGLRIDYVFVTAPLLARCTDARIDVRPREESKPSDHVPVVLDYA